MDAWVTLLQADPRPWLLASDEPAARWVALRELLGRPDTDPEVVGAREAVLHDPLTAVLISRLPDWELETEATGHDSPKYAPNLLNLLADMGLRQGDSRKVDSLLEQFLRHQEESGRFQSYGRSGHGSVGQMEAPVWGALLCDAHVIAEVLVRYGYAGDPRVQAALQRIAQDQGETAQGEAWPCIPHTASGFRGPGRKADICTMVTLEALRAFAWLPPEQRPAGALAGARVMTRAWLERGAEKPYMFGHGYSFKVVKWPTFWYGIYWVLDTLSRYPELWSGPAARAEDRQAVAELAACLVAYNFGPAVPLCDGTPGGGAAKAGRPGGGDPCGRCAKAGQLQGRDLGDGRAEIRAGHPTGRPAR